MSAFLRRIHASRYEPILAAWQRVLRLWWPMAGWTVLVWVTVAVVLGPLSTALLGWHVVLGPQVVVGNEALLAWLLTPRGATWAILAGSLAVTGAVIRYAGLFHIVTDDLSGHRPTVVRTALHLVPQLPALFRLSAVAVAAGAVMAAVLVAGLAGVRAAALAEFDINYYLAERPPEWRGAVMAATAWAVVWALGALFVVGRTVLAVPAYLDGHQPLRVAFQRAADRGHGQKPRLFKLLAVSVGIWLLVRLALNATYYATGALALDGVAALSDSLRPVLAATAAYAGGLFVLDAVVGFLGFSFVATVLTKFYFEDTDLHEAAAPDAGLGALPWRVMRRARPWFRPRRAVPLLAVAVLASVMASGFMLDRLPEVRPVVVSAHRAGPPPAPENTLAALERAIAAGADYSEIDVQRTRDGVLVLVHDVDFMRVAGDRRRVADVNYEDVAGLVQLPDDGSPASERRVATLEEFLDRARGRIGLMIELKYYGHDPGLAPAVVEAVRAHGAQDILFMSLSVEGVRQLASLAPEYPVGYVSAAAVGDLTRLPVQFLAVARPRVTPRLLRASSERGMVVHAWTVNQAAAMAELMDRGIDGLITDDPALAVRVREEMLSLSLPARLLLRFRPGLLDTDTVPERQ
jgi:glycerophosphoryl diester phosphodiesterase